MAAPINIDKANALVPEFQTGPDRYYYIQSTSDATPVYYELWYKLANAVVCKGSATVHNLSQGLPAASIITVYDEADNVLAQGSTVHFERVPNNLWYYFKVTTPQTPPLADVIIDITINIVRGGPILSSSTVIQNEKANERLSVIIGSVEAFNYIGHVVNGSNPTDTNHTLNGKCGDILPSGETCIEDQAIKGVTIRNKYYGVPLTAEGEDGSVSRPLGLVTVNDLYYIKRNANGLNFWLSYLLAGTPIVRSIQVTGGVLGPVFDLGGKVIAMCAKADQVLYYTIESDPAVVRRWNLVTNRRATDLTAPTALVRDIIISSAGEVIVLYVGATSAHVYKYSETGSLLLAFEFPTINSAARINYAGPIPTQFVLWTHEPGISIFRWININNGSVYNTITIKEFNINGGYINVADLYEQKQGNVYLGPVQRVGAGPASNFWIQPVVSKAGCFVPYTIPPEDEYFPPTFPPFNYPDFGQNPSQSPGGVYPYPPGAPDTPPVIPIEPPPPSIVNPANIGGGLIIIEPTNAVRHDVYQGRNAGETLQASIIAYVRTAFLGD